MRSLPLDLLRIIACLMVILMHSPIPGDVALVNGVFLTATSFVTSPCVPLFFMVSGALLLKGASNEPDTKTWLKRRLGKVVAPTIVFSLFYIFLNYSSDSWSKMILSIPFSAQGHGVLWFMYALIGLYLITPIIKPWISRVDKREVELYLLIWFVTLLFPYLGLFVEINRSDTGSFYYLSGYVGYYILGYYLSHWPLGKKTFSMLLGASALMLTLPLLNKTLSLDLDFYTAFWYLSAPVCIMSATWFSSIMRLFNNNSKTYKAITTISNLSFGIYLVHIGIMRNFLWKLALIQGIENYYIQTGVVFVATTVLSFLICWGISFLPFGQWIIGTKRLRG